MEPDKAVKISGNPGFYITIALIVVMGFLVARPEGFISGKNYNEPEKTRSTGDTSLRVTAVYPWDGFTHRVVARRKLNRKIYMNAYLAVEVNNILLLCNRIKNGEGDPVLYLNDIPLYSLKPSQIDRDNGFVIYYLDATDSTLQKCDIYFKNLFSSWPLNNISLGFRGKPKFDTGVYAYRLYPIERHAIWVLLCMIGIIAGTFWTLNRSTVLLRVANRDSQYSLAFSQIAFWTVVILTSHIYLWMSTQNYDTITPTALIIMGISAGTASGSRMISKQSIRRQAERLMPQQDPVAIAELGIRKSKGFFNDLFCDHQGSSISRWQMVVWTILMGIVFIWTVISEKKMPEFSNELLMLIGISSGAYLLLKPFEQLQTPAQDDEIIRQKSETQDSAK